MSERILTIETSTDCCSAAICEEDKVLSERSGREMKIHASQLVPFIKEVCDESGTDPAGIAAVAVSGGPGSYTGLRVGVSTAKGICFGRSLPLVSVDTLEILATQGMGHDCAPFRIVPFIDARRMEVYTAVFDAQARKLTETEAVILTEESFSDLLSQGPVLFIGTGVEKFRSVCKSPNAFFMECHPMAGKMARAAFEAYKKKEFKDIAYFEPFYLKEFMIGVSKKSLL